VGRGRVAWRSGIDHSDPAPRPAQYQSRAQACRSAAEFDTRLPHWFGPAGDQPVEILSLFGGQGERIHVRAAPRRKSNNV